MSISEGQLETWSHQGSTAQSAATYQWVKDALEDPQAPFASRDFEIFLQGSYCNDTNIFADSDVDVIICLNSTYYSDLGQLTDVEKASYDRDRVPAKYTIDDFKREVADWLTRKFGSRVRVGNKAIFVPGDRSRRDCDVLACAQHRRYQSYQKPYSQDFHRGICFWSKDGTYIVNFPKQHSGNCTKKHQETSAWFKPTVRVFKNMRNRMAEQGYLEDGVAPSYFLEGMLWNVPTTSFTTNFKTIFESCHQWLSACDASKLTCANGLHWLLRSNNPVCWNEAAFRTFLQASRKFWNAPQH